MPPANLVEIVVYDAPAAASSGCACGCSGHGHGHSHDDDLLSRVSVELQTRALALTLEKAFPGKVRVEYLNVLQDPEACRLPQAKLLCSLAYPTPLVYINGRGRFAGAIPVERVMEEVGKLLEANLDKKP